MIWEEEEEVVTLVFNFFRFSSFQFLGPFVSVIGSVRISIDPSLDCS